MDDDRELRGCDRPPVAEAGQTSRRAFLTQGAAVATGMAAAAAGGRGQAAPAKSGRATEPAAALPLLRRPDWVTVYERFEATLPAGGVALLDRRGDAWRSRQLAVETRVEGAGLVLTLTSPAHPVALVHLRWDVAVPAGSQALGDAWERSYGDLGWRPLVPERTMPWYFVTRGDDHCHGYGVRTDAAALCFWQLDENGASLWLDVSSGGAGVELGTRSLQMATVIVREGHAGETEVEAVTALCRALCARPTRPVSPIYGANDWCYSYGTSTAASILRDTDFVVELSPSGGVRPFSVIDGGWSEGTPAWPSMERLAQEIGKRSARPGLWIRPLEAPAGTSPELLLPAARFGSRTDRSGALAYDPTVPAARERISAKLRQLRGWGYELIKHDFSTYDLLGQWGFEMGPQPTLPGWSFADRTRTNAEVLTGLYLLLREAVGPDVLLDGCNTVGHLGQGIFDLQRTGDDTSGHQAERTRRMGVNTLAFRLPQHGTFFAVDADVVGLTDAVPWEFNRQWLSVLAESGTSTMVSLGPPAHGAAQRDALRAAFQTAAQGGSGLRPAEWASSSAPEHWRGADGSERRYQWNGQQGASPFLSP